MVTLSDEFLVQFERLSETVRRDTTGHATESFVQKTPGVCGGDACVRNTRIPVWAVIQMLRMGRTEDQVVADLPSLVPSDVEAAWAYYRQHPAEIESNIAQNGDVDDPA